MTSEEDLLQQIRKLRKDKEDFASALLESRKKLLEDQIKLINEKLQSIRLPEIETGLPISFATAPSLETTQPGFKVSAPVIPTPGQVTVSVGPESLVSTGTKIAEELTRQQQTTTPTIKGNLQAIQEDVKTNLPGLSTAPNVVPSVNPVGLPNPSPGTPLPTLGNVVTQTAQKTINGQPVTEVITTYPNGVQSISYR